MGRPDAMRSYNRGSYCPLRRVDFPVEVMHRLDIKMGWDIQEESLCPGKEKPM